MSARPGAGGAAWRALVVDDEPLARLRLRQLLVETAVPEGCAGIVEAGSAAQALAQLEAAAADPGAGPLRLVFADIRMPGMDGLRFARALRERALAAGQAPHLVFVTAHAQHALEAFELDAVDYLTKPVSRERLASAIRKGLRLCAAATPAPPMDGGCAAAAGGAGDDGGDESLWVEARGRLLRVALDDVVYVRAELKYLTVRTPQGAWLMAASLQELEARFAPRLVRVHRNALASAARMLGLVRHVGGAGRVQPAQQQGWQLHLRGVEETLAVSRRQLAAVQQALSAAGRDEARCDA